SCCLGMCLSVLSDINNCGSCGHVCGVAGERCSAGTCVSSGDGGGVDAPPMVDAPLMVDAPRGDAPIFGDASRPVDAPGVDVRLPFDVIRLDVNRGDASRGDANSTDADSTVDGGF